MIRKRPAKVVKKATGTRSEETGGAGSGSLSLSQNDRANVSRPRSMERM